MKWFVFIALVCSFTSSSFILYFRNLAFEFHLHFQRKIAFLNKQSICVRFTLPHWFQLSAFSTTWRTTIARMHIYELWIFRTSVYVRLKSKNQMSHMSIHRTFQMVWKWRNHNSSNFIAFPNNSNWRNNKNSLMYRCC